MLKRIKPITPLIFSAYLLFFLLLFLQLPLNNALPGPVDSWLNLALFNSHENQIKHLFFNEPLMLVNFPEGNIHKWAETSYLSAALYLQFDWPQLPDIYSFYLFYSIVFALNSFCFYIFLRYTTKNHLAAILGGLAFSCLNFTMAQLDHQNTLVFFPIFLSTYHLLRGLTNKQKKHIIVAALWGGLQIYFGAYTFLMCVLFLGLAALTVSLGNTFSEKIKFSCILLIPIIIIVLPYLYLHVFNSPLLGLAQEIMSLDTLDSNGLALQDLFRVLPNNLLYDGCCKNYSLSLPEGISYHWHSAFIGFLIPIAAFAGIWFCPISLRLFLISAVLIGVLLAFGPFYGESNGIRTPMYLVYKLFPFLKGFSHINRFYFLAIIPLLTLAAFAFATIFNRLQNSHLRYFTFVLLLLFILLENLPFPLVNYEKNQYITMPEQLTQLSSEVSQDSSVLFLPAFGPRYPGRADINKYVRGKRNAYIYMYWQTQMKCNIINANSSFAPKNRNAIYQIIKGGRTLLPNLEKVQTDFSLRYIVYVKENTFDLGGSDILDLLKRSEKLALASENERIAIFKTTQRP